MTLSVAADLLIAASMCWYLYRKKTGSARQGHPAEVSAVLTFVHRTDSIITTLMAYCINSGLVVA